MRRQVCPECKRPLTFCLCEHISKVSSAWPMIMLQHAREAGHPLNTGRIARLALPQCRTVTVTDADSVDAGTVSCQSLSPVLIYPSDTAADISGLAGSEPVPLIFIDATWRKSRRLLFQSDWLARLPAYSFCARDRPRYRIRREPETAYYSTLESIVYSLIALGEESAPLLGLLEVMDRMIGQQIEAMGQDRFRHYYGDNA